MERNELTNKAQTEVTASKSVSAVPQVKLPSRLTFYEDAGHGWLAVKRSLLKALGIEKDITDFSYQKGDTVYLEEDADATCFWEALEAAGFTPEQINAIVVKKSYREHSPIRSYDSYKSGACIKYCRKIALLVQNAKKRA